MSCNHFVHDDSCPSCRDARAREHAKKLHDDAMYQQEELRRRAMAQQQDLHDETMRARRQAQEEEERRHREDVSLQLELEERRREEEDEREEMRRIEAAEREERQEELARELNEEQTSALREVEAERQQHAEWMAAHADELQAKEKVEKAARLIDKGLLDDALELLAAARKLDPENAHQYRLTAFAHVRAGRPAEAVDSFLAFMRINNAGGVSLAHTLDHLFEAKTLFPGAQLRVVCDAISRAHKEPLFPAAIHVALGDLDKAMEVWRHWAAGPSLLAEPNEKTNGQVLQYGQKSMKQLEAAFQKHAAALSHRIWRPLQESIQKELAPAVERLEQLREEARTAAEEALAKAEADLARRKQEAETERRRLLQKLSEEQASRASFVLKREKVLLRSFASMGFYIALALPLLLLPTLMLLGLLPPVVLSGAGFTKSLLFGLLALAPAIVVYARISGSPLLAKNKQDNPDPPNMPGRLLGTTIALFLLGIAVEWLGTHIIPQGSSTGSKVVGSVVLYGLVAFGWFMAVRSAHTACKQLGCFDLAQSRLGKFFPSPELPCEKSGPVPSKPSLPKDFEFIGADIEKEVDTSLFDMGPWPAPNLAIGGGAPGNLGSSSNASAATAGSPRPATSTSRLASSVRRPAPRRDPRAAEAIAILERPREWAEVKAGGFLKLKPGAYPSKRQHVEEYLEDIRRVREMGIDDPVVARVLADAEEKARSLCARESDFSVTTFALAILLAIIGLNVPESPSWVPLLLISAAILYPFTTAKLGYHHVAILVRRNNNLLFRPPPERPKTTGEFFADFISASMFRTMFLIFLVPLQFINNYILHTTPKGAELVLGEGASGSGSFVAVAQSVGATIGIPASVGRALARLFGFAGSLAGAAAKTGVAMAKEQMAKAAEKKGAVGEADKAAAGCGAHESIYASVLGEQSVAGPSASKPMAVVVGLFVVVMLAALFTSDRAMAYFRTTWTDLTASSAPAESESATLAAAPASATAEAASQTSEALPSSAVAPAKDAASVDDVSNSPVSADAPTSSGDARPQEPATSPAPAPEAVAQSDNGDKSGSLEVKPAAAAPPAQDAVATNAAPDVASVANAAPPAAAVATPVPAAPIASVAQPPATTGTPVAGSPQPVAGPGAAAVASAPPVPPKPIAPTPILLDVAQLQAAASSSAKPNKGANPPITYWPEMVLDDDLNTAWCEGVKNFGEGQWLEIRFRTPVAATALRIWNGYQKYLDDKFGDRYYINARPETVTISTESGEMQTNLADDKEMQEILLDGKKTTFIRIKINSVYGAKYKDTCLSQIRVMALPDPK